MIYAASNELHAMVTGIELWHKKYPISWTTGGMIEIKLIASGAGPLLRNDFSNLNQPIRNQHFVPASQNWSCGSLLALLLATESLCALYYS